MVQRYWESYEKPIRDKVRDLINTRATTDSITVAEIKAAIHPRPERYAPNGIYVGLPRCRPDTEGEQSEANTDILDFPVICNVRSWTEAEQLDLLGKFVSLVVDAIEAKTTLDGQLGVENAWIAEKGEPEPGIGGAEEFAIMRIVRVAVLVTRTTS